jgi:hypothetical protein
MGELAEAASKAVTREFEGGIAGVGVEQLSPELRWNKEKIDHLITKARGVRNVKCYVVYVRKPKRAFLITLSREEAE